MGLRGKTVLVTGASGAIGSAIVRAAKLQGAWVAGTYHNHRPTPQECPADLLEPVDVRSKTSVTQWVAKCLAHNGQIDGLVTSAGNVQDHTLVKLTDADWDDVLQTHLTGTFNTLQAVLPAMQYHRLGKIITVISQAGIHGRFGQTNYAAAKAGIIGLTRSAAKELGEWGIEVNMICPGFTPSRMTEAVPPEGWERARNASVMGMLGDAEVLANLTLWLLSDDCRGISGQIFYADSRMQ